MEIHYMKYADVRPVDFSHIETDKGTMEGCYVLLHFINPMTFTLYDNIGVKKIVDTEPHSVILLQKGVRHGYFQSNGEPLAYNWLTFFEDDENMSKILSEYGIKLNTFYYPSQHARISKIFADIEELYIHKGSSFRIMVPRCIEEIFLLLGADDDERYISNKTRKILLELRNEIHDRIDAKWTIDMMLKKVCFNRSYFETSYKRLFRISPMEEVIGLKIKKATQRIKESDESLCDIAESLGYSNYTHFSRQFTKFMGISPSAYRRKHK